MRLIHCCLSLSTKMRGIRVHMCNVLSLFVKFVGPVKGESHLEYYSADTDWGKDVNIGPRKYYQWPKTLTIDTGGLGVIPDTDM